MSLTITHEEKGQSSFANRIASMLQKPKSVIGRVSSVKTETSKGRNIWHILMTNGEKLACGDPAIAQSLGAGGAGVPKIPVDLKVVEKGGVSVVVAAQVAGEQSRRRMAVDLTNPEFIDRIAQSDASDVASFINSSIKRSEISDTQHARDAIKAYAEWEVRGDIGSKAWRDSLFEVLKAQKIVTDHGHRQGREGFFYLKKLSNLGLNIMACTAAEMNRGQPSLLGSMVIGQLNDSMPEAKVNTAISVAWAAYLTIRKAVGPSAEKDLKVIADTVARSAMTSDQEKRKKEIVVALSWAWQSLRSKQPDMDRNRYSGPIGGAIRNVETAIQWIGGAIPDHGPLAGALKHFDRPGEREFVRAIAFQQIRGNPILEIDRGGEGVAIGKSGNSETTVFGKNKSAKVYDSDGTLLFEEGNDEPTARAPGM